MKILVCVDGSSQSQKAVVEAAEIAEGMKAQSVTILNVSEARSVFTDYRIDNEELAELVSGQRKQILESAKEKFQEKSSVRVETLLKEGHPSSVIKRVAEEDDYDMIIMGNRGAGGGIRKTILGSVTNAVIQEVNCSKVLVVKCD